jgi:hypothetical protein
MARTDNARRVTALDLETARRAWVLAMGTADERAARAAYVALVEKAKQRS